MTNRYDDDEIRRSRARLRARQDQPPPVHRPRRPARPVGGRAGETDRAVAGRGQSHRLRSELAVRVADHARARRVPQDQALQGNDDQRHGPQGDCRRRREISRAALGGDDRRQGQCRGSGDRRAASADLLRPVERAQQVRRLHDRRLVLRRLLRSQGAVYRSDRKLPRRPEALLLGSEPVASLDAQALFMERQGLRHAVRRRRPGALLPQGRLRQEGEPGQVQGEVRLRPAGAAEDHQGISRRRGFLHRMGLERRRPERLRHLAARQGQRAGILPLPDALGAFRRLAGQQVLFLQSGHDEAADQFGGPSPCARGLREVPRQRPERADRLDARARLEPVPRRTFGDRADLGRSADARAGSEDLEGPGQDGRGAPARNDRGLQSDQPASGRSTTSTRSATPMAAAGTA